MIHMSVSLKYELSSELLHDSVKELFLDCPYTTTTTDDVSQP
jgi:hypothetical protein